MDRASIDLQKSNWWILCPKQRIPPCVTHSEATSLVQARNACGTRCERRFGGCCRLTVCFSAHPTPSGTISHARDGEWSYEGVMWPDHL